MPEPIKVTIGEYSDFFSYWWGLKDGTLLPTCDTASNFWIKLGKETMTVEEFGTRQDDSGD